MTDAGNTPTSGEIDIALAFFVPDINSFSSLNGDALFDEKRGHTLVFYMDGLFTSHVNFFPLDKKTLEIFRATA
jgi:hypothetical protein